MAVTFSLVSFLLQPGANDAMREIERGYSPWYALVFLAVIALFMLLGSIRKSPAPYQPRDMAPSNISYGNIWYEGGKPRTLDTPFGKAVEVTQECVCEDRYETHWTYTNGEWTCSCRNCGCTSYKQIEPSLPMRAIKIMVGPNPPRCTCGHEWGFHGRHLRDENGELKREWEWCCNYYVMQFSKNCECQNYTSSAEKHLASKGRNA
jgi:hypothetical protein